MSEPTHPPLPGLDFVGVLGVGGFADVYAYDQRLPHRRVAVKVLRSPIGSGDSAAFLAEANAMGRLAHPHIATVHSAGLAPDGRPYLVMPYYAGGSLATRLQGGVLGVDEVLRIGVTVGGAVETAHRHQLLHRDIKPANLLLDQYDNVVLADFGLVGTAYGDDDAGLSVPWSAPEVLFGDAPASPSSDVYSLAATLWTLLEGHAPFASPTHSDPHSAAVLAGIRHSPPPPLRRVGVPASLECLLRQALEKDPMRRPLSAVVLAEGLRAVQAELGLPVADPAVALPSAPVRPRPPTAVVRASGLLEPSTVAAIEGDDPALADFDGRTEGTSQNPAVGEPSGPQPRHASPRLLLVLPLLAAVAIALLIAVSSRPRVDLRMDRSGDQVRVTWTYSHPRPGDSFAVSVLNRRVIQQASTITVTAPEGVCVSVEVLTGLDQARGPQGVICG